MTACRCPFSPACGCGPPSCTVDVATVAVAVAAQSSQTAEEAAAAGEAQTLTVELTAELHVTIPEAELVLQRVRPQASWWLPPITVLMTACCWDPTEYHTTPPPPFSTPLPGSGCAREPTTQCRTRHKADFPSDLHMHSFTQQNITLAAVM